MLTNISRLSVASILISSLALFGCSSGGGDAGVAAPSYSGNTLPAAITTASSEQLGRTATEGVNEAVNLVEAGTGIPFFSVPLAVDTATTTATEAEFLKDVALAVLQGSTGLNLPGGAELTSDQLGYPFCGGSVIVPDNLDPNTSMNFSMTFRNLCYDDGVTPLQMNGVLTFAGTDTTFSITFTNFSVTIDGTVETFSGSFSCDMTQFECTIATDYVGSDGNVFRLADVVVSETIGYDISANFYHYEFGMVSITTDSPVTYGSCGIYPDAGQITLTGSAGSSMTVIFSGCTFTVQGTDGTNAFGPDLFSWPV